MKAVSITSNPPKRWRQLFPYAPQALENTKKIGDRCHVEIEFGVTKLPKYDVPDGYTSWEYLNKLCWEGLEEKYHPVTEELKERLTYELNTIKTMGYVDYFLIVWDFINYARSRVSGRTWTRFSGRKSRFLFPGHHKVGPDPVSAAV